MKKQSVVKVREVIEEHLLALPGVVGISHSISHSSKIKVYVESKEVINAIPRFLANMPVEVEVTGPLFALGEPINRRGVVRPLVGGISVSNIELRSAGTLSLITSNLPGVYLLSNAHVIAMKFVNGSLYFVEKPTEIVQPGVIDGGTKEHKVATLFAYWPIIFNDLKALNYLDAAIGWLGPVEYYNRALLLEEIKAIDITHIDVEVGDMICKSGRTTGVTYGPVIETNASLKIFFGSARMIWGVFRDCIMVKGPGFSKPGDSGSLCIKDNRCVGLLFAGNSDYTIICKAKYMSIIPPVAFPAEVPVPKIEPIGAWDYTFFGISLLLASMIRK